MNLNLIWCLKSDYEINFSKQWILEIFSKFQITETYDKNFDLENFLENSLIVVSNVTEKLKFYEYIEIYNKRGLNYCILHLSDEICNHDITYYKIAKKVIRTLHNQKYQDTYNTFTIPVGYKTGIKKTTDQKKYLFNFIGQIKSDRYQMLKTFENVPNKYYFITSQWDDPNGLKIDDYSKILSESFFTLCPRGWDGTPIETFRLSESLECGSIPISIFDNGIDYFKIVFGEDHPFVVGTDWFDALNKLVSIQDHQQKLNETKEWWVNFKNDLKQKLFYLYQQ